jgi:hypothetical protein
MNRWLIAIMALAMVSQNAGCDSRCARECQDAPAEAKEDCIAACKFDSDSGDKTEGGRSRSSWFNSRRRTREHSWKVRDEGSSGRSDRRTKTKRRSGR